MGKRRLERALKTAKSTLGVEADIEWLPFFLNAGLPEKGTNKLEHYNKKFGASRVRSMIPHMQETGKKEGIDFSYGGMIANTLNAHRLVSFAREQGKADAVMEELFKHYFERESNLGDEATLIDAANKAGVTGADELFKTDAEKDNVLREVAMVQSDYGVTGVPFFIFDDKFAFSGAQDSDTIVSVIKQVLKKRSSADEKK